MTDTPSPLTEAQPDSLDELMRRLDQHVIHRTFDTPAGQFDLDAMIRELRRQRELWTKAEASGAKRAPKAKKVKVTDTTTQDILDALSADTKAPK